MARTSRPDSIWHVSLHRNAGHTYAATHPYTTDAEGKRKYSIVHWGKVTEDLQFIPGKRYLEAPQDVRRKLVFPEGWDLSAAAGAAAPRLQAQPLPFGAADAGKAFGSIWLLESIIGRFGVREDLAECFGGTAADDLLTLAYYPFLTGMSFLRFQRWQSATKLPSSRPLEVMLEESVAKVGGADLRRFMELRRARHEGERICAVDSVSRYSPGDTVSDRKWGQKTEKIHFQTTVEAVAYSLDSHVPVVYTAFPEAIADARGMGRFRAELEKAGLPAVTVVTDRGYDSLKRLEPYFAQGPMVMCVDAKQPAVMQRIRAFGQFREHPAGMRYDAASRRWGRQYRLGASGAIGGPGASKTSGTSKTSSASGGLRLNLFFNPERRAAELSQIDAEIASQQAALQEIRDYRIALEDRKSLRRDYYFFNAVYDNDTHTVTSFSPDSPRILATRAASGFYANITSGLDIGPVEAVSIYGLKYDQEKFLRQFRSVMDFPVRPLRFDKLVHGIQVMQYIALLLNTWLRHALKASLESGSALPFRTVMELLDELHSVPCADAGDGTCIPAPLTPSQQQIITSLGFRLPD